MIDERWADLTDEQRINATAVVFEAICEANNIGGCTFRKLIYGLLGHDPPAYTPLYYAGGMRITNAMPWDEPWDSQEDDDQ